MTAAAQQQARAERKWWRVSPPGCQAAMSLDLAGTSLAAAVLATAALVALTACGGTAATPPPLANGAGAPPELLAFGHSQTLWQLRRDGDRVWLASRGAMGDADYEGTQSGDKLVLRETCKGARAELACTWQENDIYPPGVQMRQGCLEEKDLWPVPGVSTQTLVCEITKGQFPYAVRELVFLPGRPVETTSSSCDRGNALIIRGGYREMSPERARAARAPVHRLACPRRPAR